MKKLALQAAAISLLLAGSASAADLRRPMPVKAPPPAVPIAVYNWTGCYVGAGGGYGMFDQETRFVQGNFTSLENDNGGRGWFGTAQVGCDYQIGSNIVIGAFADYDWSGIKGDMVPGNLGGGLVGEEKLRSSWAAGGRIGWVPWSTTQLLVYVSGGYAEARFNQVNFSFLNGNPAPTNLALAKHTYTGWFVGTGYEYGLSWFPFQGVFWKTEYRFYDYSADQVPIFFISAPAPAAAPAAVQNQFLNNRKFVQTIRTELVWRFNWGNWGAPVAARY